MSAQTFSPSLLDNYTNFKSFFHKSSPLVAEPRSYFGKWQISCTVMTTPIRIFFMLLFQTLGQVIDWIGIKSISRRLLVSVELIGNDIQALYHKCIYGSRLLIPSINVHKLANTDIYLQPTIPAHKIKAAQIRNKLHEKFQKIRFFNGGLCGGASFWFNHLILKELKKGDPIEKAARRVADLFADGIPRQAALLQAFHGTGGSIETHLLNLSQRTALTIFPKAIQNKPKDVIEIIHQIKDGVYLLGLHKHAISYVKTKEGQFIWDPNTGLIKIESPRQILDEIKRYVKQGENNPIFFLKHSKN